MNDRDFLAAAVDQLTDETCAAARAALVAQVVLGVRLRPVDVEQIADAYRAPRGAVLALLGWACDEERPSVRMDLFDQDGQLSEPERRETMFAQAICRTLQ